MAIALLIANMVGDLGNAAVRGDLRTLSALRPRFRLRTRRFSVTILRMSAAALSLRL